MRRADRLFDIIQTLRTAQAPVTAESLAKHLEVTVRTVYRDIATLQARRVPIEGAAGIGYVLRRGFDLPPLMFSTEEIEAIAVGMRMLRRTGDAGLQAAAETVLSKVTVACPTPCASIFPRRRSSSRSTARRHRRWPISARSGPRCATNASCASSMATRRACRRNARSGPLPSPITRNRPW